MQIRKIFGLLVVALALVACSSTQPNQAGRFSSELSTVVGGTWAQTDTAACSKLLTAVYTACVIDGQSSRIKSIRLVCEPLTSLDEWKAAFKPAAGAPAKAVKTTFADEPGIGESAVVRFDNGKIEGLYTYVRGHRCSVHTDPIESARADLVAIAKVFFTNMLT